jgi:hypothetical protein
MLLALAPLMLLESLLRVDSDPRVVAGVLDGS